MYQVWSQPLEVCHIAASNQAVGSYNVVVKRAASAASRPSIVLPHSCASGDCSTRSCHKHSRTNARRSHRLYTRAIHSKAGPTACCPLGSQHWAAAAPTVGDEQRCSFEALNPKRHCYMLWRLDTAQDEGALDGAGTSPSASSQQRPQSRGAPMRPVHPIL